MAKNEEKLEKLFPLFKTYFWLDGKEWKDEYENHCKDIKDDLWWYPLKEDTFYLSVGIKTGNLYFYLDEPVNNDDYISKVLSVFPNSKNASPSNDVATYMLIGNIFEISETDIKDISDKIKQINQ